ncbi:hypothetical protein SEA_ABBA_59 [Arthrobacter phage Abba]|uniref:Uncharacterized protein n=1 Tax=Arthrobacter phage Abba TaxID=2713256 RepID=A0A6G8R355_9CAUD|nr:hypothetical protein HYQ28_gp59 [Arthrobacter phage Abba]QIN94388.1 hypothetical protein SEA_ABBA_59 [Arthrobacter phage Abba]
MTTEDRIGGLMLTAVLMRKLGVTEIAITDFDARTALSNGEEITAHRDVMRQQTVIKIKPGQLTGELVTDPEAAQATQSSTTLIAFSHR